MARLPRPNPSVEVRCRVVLRQLGEFFIDDVIRANRFVPRVVPSRNLGRLLDEQLAALAALLKCEVKDLWLDHDPALENREKLVEMPNGHRRRTVVVPKDAKVLRYFPDANDPEHLFYRPQGTQFAGSHDVKTRIRGDRGQLSDNALAKKERRRLRKLDPNRRHVKIPQRKKPWPKGRKIQNRRKR